MSDQNRKDKYRIAVIAGDGIGPEVIKEARLTAEAAASLEGASIEWMDYPFARRTIWIRAKFCPRPLSLRWARPTPCCWAR